MKTNGGAEGARTPDLRIANAALCQTELLPHDEREYSFKFQDSSFEIGQMVQSDRSGGWQVDLLMDFLVDEINGRCD